MCLALCRYALGFVCVSLCELFLVLVSMPISVPLSISADTSVDGGFVCVWEREVGGVEG